MSDLPNMDQHVFGTLDYVIVMSVVGVSMAVGLYYAWRARHLKSTRDFLVASSNFGVFPLVLSSAATLISPVMMFGIPADVYNNGLQVIMLSVTPFVGSVFTMLTVTPIYFRMNISTVTQYAEYRFNRFLRICLAVLKLAQSTLLMASLAHLTVLIVSDSTKISYWATMAIVWGTCIIYSSMGGFSAIIWTDVIQMIIMVVSLLTFVVMGTQHLGGFSQVWNRNYEGGRTVLIRFSVDNGTYYSFWSLIIGGLAMGIGVPIFGQSQVQRQMANKTLTRAKMTLFISPIILGASHMLASWVGMIVYARYYDCDPLMQKQIRSRDQLATLFAREIFDPIDGLSGLFVAGMLAASMSTMSSSLNSFSTIVIIDFIKPYFPRIKERMATVISKCLGLAYGVVTVALTLVVSKFETVMQVSYMIFGLTVAPSCGVLILGMFSPWATSKGASVGYMCSLVVIGWAAIGNFMLNRMPKQHLPVSTDGCVANNLEGRIPRDLILQDLNNNTMRGSDFITVINETQSKMLASLQNHTEVDSIGVEDIFFLYTISPLYYFAIAIIVLMVVGNMVSVVTGIQDPEALDPRLISPFTWLILGKLPVRWRKWLGFKSERFHGDMKLATIYNEKIHLTEIELADISPNQPTMNENSNRADGCA